MDLATIRSPCSDEPPDEHSVIVIPPLLEDEHEQETSADGNYASWNYAPPIWRYTCNFRETIPLSSGGYVHEPQNGPFLPRTTGGWDIRWDVGQWWTDNWGITEKKFYVNVCEGFSWAGAWPANPPMPGRLIARYWLSEPSSDVLVPLHGTSANEICCWLEGFLHASWPGGERWEFGLGVVICEVG